MTIPYYSSLRNRARELRKNQTQAEYLFWQEVRNRKILGYKFMRQKPIIEYIVDFYCHDLKLVIEIDGGIHEQQKEYDSIRTKQLESFGLTVIRLTNSQILSNLNQTVKWLKLRISTIKNEDT